MRPFPLFTGLLTFLVFTVSANAHYEAYPQDVNQTLGHYVQEFGALGIVAFVVYWMMKRIDALIKVLQKSVENIKVMEAASTSQHAAIIETQRQILMELRNFKSGLDSPNSKV